MKKVEIKFETIFSSMRTMALKTFELKRHIVSDLKTAFFLKRANN